VQGGTGQTGVQGLATAGAAGDAGPSGFQGARGDAGPVGAQGAVGIVERWTAYREFNFDRTASDMRVSEMNRISEIAAYLAQNPSLEVGIDGSMAVRGFNQGERDLSNLRADSVREALMQAGVPSYKIQMGAFADPSRLQQGQIQVLIKTRA
jgi:outer membrane protein OmpA-like peptidoglycan-associated protein